jgi:hypothetical protein
LVKLYGSLEINKHINIGSTNSKFYYIVAGVDQNNSPIKDEKVIDIPNGKYDFNESATTINELLNSG